MSLAEYPFDVVEFRRRNTPLLIVTTRVADATPCYHLAEPESMMAVAKASCSVPVAYRNFVLLHGDAHTDGGVADSIPSAWLFAQGYDRNIVVLTQPAGFVKQPNSVMPMLRRVFRHYPEFVAALEHRHEVYNATLDDLARREAAGEIFVVRPSESVKVPSLCREPDELERIYQIGRRDAEATLPALEAYLAG